MRNIREIHKNKHFSGQKKTVFSTFLIRLGFKGTVVNRAFLSLHGALLEIKLYSPFLGIKSLLPLRDEDFQGLVLASKELVYGLMKECPRQLFQGFRVQSHLSKQIQIIKGIVHLFEITDY